MKIIDLSHKFSVDDMVFPGTQGMSYTKTHTIEKDSYNLGIARINSHAGTHTDAPYHFIPNGKKLGEVDLNIYVGPAVAIDCRNKKALSLINVSDIKPYEEEIIKKKRVLICTNWYKQVNTEAFYTEYPAITVELADYLISLGVILIGVEGPSLSESKGMEVHQHLLGKEIAIIESMKNLDQLLGKEFILCSAPLAFMEADGFPIRAYALIN